MNFALKNSCRLNVSELLLHGRRWEENTGKGESLKVAPIEVYEETLSQDGIGEAKTGNGLGSAQMRPNRRKWKLQAGNPNSNGENKNRLGALKRLSCELTGPSPKQKEVKVTSPPKLETKQY